MSPKVGRCIELKTGWGAPVCPEKISQVKSRVRVQRNGLRGRPPSRLRVFAVSLFRVFFLWEFAQGSAIRIGVKASESHTPDDA